MTSGGSNFSLGETGFDIIHHNYNQGNTIGIISAFSQGEETNMNDADMPKALLKEAARRLHFGFAEFSGRWTDNGEASGGEALPESGYIVFGSPDNDASVWKLLKLFDIKYGPKRFLLITGGEAERIYANNYNCTETLGPFNCTQQELQSIYTAFYRTKRFAKDRRNKYKLGFILDNIAGSFPVRPFLPAFAEGLEYRRALTLLRFCREPYGAKRHWTEEMRSEYVKSIDGVFAHTSPDSAEIRESAAKAAPFGVISAFRPDNTPEENRARSQRLEDDLGLILFDFDLIKGCYPDGGANEAEEDYIIYTYSKRRDELQNYLVSAVREFGQEAALFVSGGQAFLLYGDGRRESLGAFSYGDPEALAEMLGKAKKRPFRLGDPDAVPPGEPFGGCVIKTVMSVPGSMAHAYGCQIHENHLKKYKENYFQTEFR